MSTGRRARSTAHGRYSKCTVSTGPPVGGQGVPHTVGTVNVPDTGGPAGVRSYARSDPAETAKSTERDEQSGLKRFVSSLLNGTHDCARHHFFLSVGRDAVTRMINCRPLLSPSKAGSFIVPPIIVKRGEEPQY
jgi:hypothetical protein